MAEDTRQAHIEETQEQAQQDTQQQAAPETAGGQAVSTGGQLTTTEATARELTPNDDGETDIFIDIRHPKKKAFLLEYALNAGRVVEAARLAGVNRAIHYIWLRDDPVYAEAFERAQQMALDVVRDEVTRRGCIGYEEPIIYQGKITGTVRRYSDNLLMFEAKRRDPAYRDNWTQVGIMAGGNVQIAFVEPERGTAISST